MTQHDVSTFGGERASTRQGGGGSAWSTHTQRTRVGGAEQAAHNNEQIMGMQGGDDSDDRGENRQARWQRGGVAACGGVAGCSAAVGLV